MQSVDGLHREVEVAVLRRAPRVHDRGGALRELQVGRAEHCLVLPGQRDVGGVAARRDVTGRLVRVGKAREQHLTVGPDVHRRSRGGVAHHESRLARLGRRQVVHERGQHRVAVRVEVGHYGGVGTGRHLHPVRLDGRLRVVRIVAVREDLDVVGAGGQLDGVGEGAWLEVGDQLLAVGVDVHRQVRDGVQD